MKIKVAVGLSGGVDSAVAAVLLRRAGYEVVGVYLHCFPESYQKTLACTDKEDFKMSQKVSQALKIPFTFFDFEKEYQKKVIEYFFQEYQAGRTPNPDAVCNKEIKFGLFLDRAIGELGVDFVATGHYARVISAQNGTGSALSPASKDRLPRASTLTPIPYTLTPIPYTLNPIPYTLNPIPYTLNPIPYTLNPNYHLLQGVDSTKDQSYFLYNLSQEQLSRVLFPIGEYTKKQVRQMARDFGLPNWDRKDSQGICFLGKISVRKFLEQRIKPKRGEVMDTSGRVIGEHDGVWFYTIGQRHGFKVNRPVLIDAGSTLSPESKDRLPHAYTLHPTPYTLHPNGPLYVIDKDIENNRLMVGWGKECEKGQFTVENVNWINPVNIGGKNNTSEVCIRTPRMVEESVNRIDCKVRIRHLGELYPCRIKVKNVQVTVVLEDSAWGVAPGQVAVFYLPRVRQLTDLRGGGEELLGGGVIAD